MPEITMRVHRFDPESDHDSDDAPSSERHPDALPRDEVRLLCAVVERPPQRGIDGDREDHVTAHSMHRSCGQVCAWVGTSSPKSAPDRRIPLLVIICTRRAASTDRALPR